ncbi:hypothetical protein [Brevibacillus sp. HB2.2]|uniref:hypothetical protein n=1 Tax=Brevibacillus sp. HB2.2 TaxID=2738846 RepID=UPI00156BB5F9|nr:hypothetical protein [Brevibacillus sp. HB2.2]NRS51962.1 hypothetical protein [Brevibacillus sp. HB2.2]
MTAVKPAPDHPWKRSTLTKKVNDHIKQSIVNPQVNNWKVGGALPSWNGSK